jgi:hypothetical protein
LTRRDSGRVASAGRWSARGALGALTFGLALWLWLGLMIPTPARSQAPDRQVAGFDIFMHYGRASGRDDLWAELPGRMARIRGQLGPEVLTGGEIHVVSDINRFFEERGDTARAPRWAQAVALPARRLVVLRLPDPNVVRTLTHELSHLAVWEAAGGNHVPRWFLEGYAQLQAEEWGVQRSVTIGQAALLGNTLPFDELDTRFPPHSLSAGLAYSQSFSLVRRLVDEYGDAAIREWLAGVRGGARWQDAFRQAFGVAPSIVFEEWRDSVRVWYGWIPAIVSVTTLWALLAGLAWWARGAVRRRRQTRLEALAERERGLYPPDPDDDLFS